MSLVTVCMYVSKKLLLVFIFRCKISAILRYECLIIFLIVRNCSTFVGELYHTCRRIIVQLWVDYKMLVRLCISNEFTSRAVSLMYVITMTQPVVWKQPKSSERPVN